MPMRSDALFGCLLAFSYWGMVGYTIYWTRRGGVYPRLAPELREENPLQIGWYVVVTGWIGQPTLLALQPLQPFIFRPLPSLDAAVFDWVGLILGTAGLVATRWAQRSMGSDWRMWIDSTARDGLVQSGPYRWIRHPIYGFQILVIVATWSLVPSPFLACIVLLNLLLVVRKALLEERHLLARYGDTYRAFQRRTGMFWPFFPRR